MRVFHSFGDLPRSLASSVLAIGNFDGVHLGHQKILGRLSRIAQEKGLFSLVLTFSPHPEQFLNQRPIHLIQTLPQRLRAIRGFSPKGILVLGLTRKFSLLSPEEFATKILSRKLKARDIVIGRDFRFGKDRRGDGKSLEALGRELGFEVHTVPPVISKNKVVSSSLIRTLLAEGKVEDAHQFLGRPYEIEGRVVGGRAKGKTLGFPTANLRTANEIAPLGIYITGTVWRSRDFPSVTVVGTSPTFGVHPVTIETYLLDFSGKLYGEILGIRFFKKIRDEKSFETTEALINQIRRDVEAARAYFRKRQGLHPHD